MFTPFRHTALALMMVIVMLSAVLLSGFHHHDADQTLALEQACDVCLTLDQAGHAVIPTPPFISLVRSMPMDDAVGPIDICHVVSFVSLAQPRAPPLIAFF